MRIAIVYNDDQGLLHGEERDQAAAAGVQEAAAGVQGACLAKGWDPLLVAAPLDPAELLAALARSKAELVFNLVEAIGGETRLEPAVAWLYELAGLPYTGSGPRAIGLALEKPLTRMVLQAAGVPVPLGTVLERMDEPLAGSPPWIVKPAREDASHGICVESVVRNEAAARARARYIAERYSQPALVEEFVEGREFNVAVLGEGPGAAALELAEMDYSAFPPGLPRLVTYEAKWAPESREYHGTVPVPARELAPALARAIAATAEAAYRAVGLRDYGRVDLRIHPRLGPLILDVNANPDLSPTAGLALAAARSGIPYQELIARIVLSARGRAGYPATTRAGRIGPREGQ